MYSITVERPMLIELRAVPLGAPRSKICAADVHPSYSAVTGSSMVKMFGRGSLVSSLNHMVKNTCDDHRIR